MTDGFYYIRPVDYIGTGSIDRYSKTDMFIYNRSYWFNYIGTDEDITNKSILNLTYRLLYRSLDPVLLTIGYR
jgi:hypothetical protein